MKLFESCAVVINERKLIRPSTLIDFTDANVYISLADEYIVGNQTQHKIEHELKLALMKLNMIKNTFQNNFSQADL